MTQLHSIPHSGNITRAELDNGIVVLAYENPAVQSVNLMGSLHAGSLYEDARRNGLASLTASALLTGTRERSFDQLHSALEDNGADLGFRAHVHKLGFSGKALAEDLPLLMNVANDALRNPVFPAEHVERLRGERLTWLQYSQFDTRWRASRAMREALYPAGHAYHYSPSGSEKTIINLDVATLAEFHARHVGPRGMIIVVVGAVAADDAVSLAAEAFGDWRNEHQPPKLAVAAPGAVANSLRQDVFVAG
ncbi:MAG: pitrilysin family protein, partial [Chloroflexi bacterium]|nr:pitrilysin family protein [Chloroflexota bacterium]